MYIYTFLLRALIPSLSLLLSLSLVTLPLSPHVATHDPPSLPQPPRPFPTSRHPNYATQHRGRRPTSSTSPPPTSSYSAPLLLLLPPLCPPAPSATRPQAQGNAGSLRIQTTEHEVTTRQIWHFGTTLIRRCINFYTIVEIASTTWNLADSHVHRVS